MPPLQAAEPMLTGCWVVAVGQGSMGGWHVPAATILVTGEARIRQVSGEGNQLCLASLCAVCASHTWFISLGAGGLRPMTHRKERGKHVAQELALSKPSKVIVGT